MPSASPRRARRSRTERRKAAPPPPPPAAFAFPRWLGDTGVSRALGALWLVATVTLLVFTARGIERKITWYLAVDQYGYLTFAHDLLHGRVFHHWPPIDALAARLPARVDALSQTYVWDDGLLYCRYAPGFAMLLAAWLGLFGDDGAHYLNPTVFLALLVLMLAFQARLFRSRWHATAGVALTVLFPTMLHWWALTLVRDLPTHLAAFLGLYLLLPAHGRRLDGRRTAAAGLALGFAASIRPDAVLYLPSALLVAAIRWRREQASGGAVLRAVATGVLGVVVGLSPFLAYNWAATGNPLRPTQGMEIQNFLPAPPPVVPGEPPAPRVGFPPGAWQGGTAAAVQGGGLRLENLPRFLPGNIGHLREPHGDLLVAVAIWGALVALAQRRLLFAAAIPYTILALLFFSCWSNPDSGSRYLSGVYLFMPMLMIEGLLGTPELVRRLWRRGAGNGARAFAACVAALLVLGAIVVPHPKARDALPTLLVLLPVVGAAAAAAAGVWPARRIARIAAPALALALVTLACWRGAQGLETRARFQRPDMLRARATFAQVVEPGSVVITTEEVGRPGENIDYYSGVAHALYLTDLMRWRLTVPDAAELLARAGMKPYLLIPSGMPGRAAILLGLGQRFSIELVADIPARQAIDYFVAAAFYPRGIHMELYRLGWHGSP